MWYFRLYLIFKIIPFHITIFINYICKYKMYQFLDINYYINWGNILILEFNENYKINIKYYLSCIQNV